MDSGNWWTGVKLAVSTSGVIVVVKGANPVNGIGAGVIPAGTYFNLSVASDGVRVTVMLSTDNPASINRAPAFEQADYNILFIKTYAYNEQYSGNEIFKNLSKIEIITRGTENKVDSLFCNIGSLDGPNSSEYAPSFILEPNIKGDTTAWVMVPGLAQEGKSAPVCLVHHPHGNSGNIDNIPASLPTYLALLNSGYTICGLTGLGAAPSTYTEATGSNWGAAAGLVYRKALIDWVQEKVQAGNLFHLGLSMGALNALRYCSIYQGSSKAVMTISGAVDLADSYTNRGYSTAIKKAYGKWYVCISPSLGNAPASSPANWTPLTVGKEAPQLGYYDSPYVWRDVYAAGTSYSINDIVCVESADAVTAFVDSDPKSFVDSIKKIPVYMRHGDSDATIPAAQMTTFQSSFQLAGGQVTAETVSAGTHLGGSMFDPNATVSFFTRFNG